MKYDNKGGKNMKRKYSMKGMVTIVVTLAFVMPTVAFDSGKTIQVPYRFS